jgi:hypothetical protein
MLVLGAVVGCGTFCMSSSVESRVLWVGDNGSLVVVEWLSYCYRCCCTLVVCSRH